jgi:hypothetical protein
VETLLLVEHASSDVFADVGPVWASRRAGAPPARAVGLESSLSRCARPSRRAFA